MQEGVRKGNSIKFVELDGKFHETIQKASSSDKLVELKETGFGKL